MEKNRNFWDLEEIRTEIFSGKISKAYCYVLAKTGKIRTIRIGRKILVPAEEAARLLTEGVK
ncbi:hypothetical protein [Sporomusa sphaeroides]|uniref:hypothetical protein n=1 Tax=Sporomusa sphaeroides TaxID=47679 RepID=UPI003158E9A5